MYNLNRMLKNLEDQGRYINVGLVGAGLMGKGMVSQIANMKGMKTIIVADNDILEARKSFLNAGIPSEKIKTAFSLEEANLYISRGYYVACSDFNLVCSAVGVDAVVDATGNVDAGAEIALSSINNLKHIIMLNAETDSIIGPILKKTADEKGVIYTGSAGDEPGAVMELFDFADAMGFEIRAIGKGKNNPIDYEATPTKVKEIAESKGVSPRMISSFQEGTNTMIEMAVMSNATGFIPDIQGGHGIHSDLKDLPSKFSLKEEGGVLDKYGIVDYVHGIAPGVFAIISHKLQSVRDEMKYLSMGDGPNYVLYRPFHLTSLETPLSIAMAVLENKATIAPKGGLVSEVIAFAKKDLKAGEFMDGFGMYTCYGLIEEYNTARELNAVPICLINNRTRLLKDIKKGQMITQDMVEIDKSTTLYKLREKQDQVFHTRNDVTLKNLS